MFLIVRYTTFYGIFILSLKLSVFRINFVWAQENLDRGIIEVGVPPSILKLFMRQMLEIIMLVAYSPVMNLYKNGRNSAKFLSACKPPA
jgi:hypothetical protein